MIAPIQSDHEPAWHAEHFAEFAQRKAELGEPTPHMRIVQWMCRDVNGAERLWRAGCYAAGYSVLTAEAIWREWPWERYALDRPAFRPWLAENWAGIHTRTPRRCVRTIDAFATCLEGYARWMVNDLPALVRGRSPDMVTQYETYWKSANAVPFFGRYIAIRLLELLRRWHYMDAHLHDIRAVGADSPIRCLALLRPDRAADLLTGERRIVDAVAMEVLTDLQDTLPTSPYTFAALLCEYRKSYEERGDMPGHQTDEELSYQSGKHAAHWRERGFDTDLFRARSALFRHEALGEIQGWNGMRPLAERSLRDFGVVWSDVRFDWFGTLAAGRPVEWADA